MNIGQVAVGIVFLAFAIGAFVISYLQFKEKGYLFNNVYLWASKEERKQPYYRQSGFVFMFIGMAFLADAVYSVTDLIWAYIAFYVFIIIAVVYAIVSSIQIRRQK